MAQVFSQALGPDQSAYAALLAELQKAHPPAAPMFSPEQAGQRVAVNNQQVDLGILGQLSPDQKLSGVGGQVLKNALASREERISNRGITDPLTGEVAVDPEYSRVQAEGRRGKVLEQTLKYESARQAAAEKADREKQAAEDRMSRDSQRAEDRADQIRLAGSLRAGIGSDSRALKDQLTQAQIDAVNERVKVSREKTASAERKIRQLSNTVTTRADFLTNQLDLAEKRISLTTTGILGSQLRKIPNTDAYDLAKLVDTIKAGIGFSELQQMRMESPTGGALGQVAIKELDMLQATLGNLDTAQSPEEVKRVTKQIKSHLKNIKDTTASYRGEPSDVVGATDAGRGTAPGIPGAALPVPGGAPGTPPVVRRRLVNGVLQ
jgi:hypothetical protein